MRKISIVASALFSLLLCCGKGFAQNRFPPINVYTGDPTGVACTIPNSIVQSSTTGALSSCVGGVYVTPASGVGAVTGTAPVDCTTTGSTVNCLMAQATSSVDGYLSHLDWAAFNGKQAALGFTPYNATNPAGYISSSALTPYALLAGATFSGAIAAPNVTDSALTSGNCVQASTAGILTTVSGPCGVGTGSVTVTGSPTSGQVTEFSGGTSITNATSAHIQTAIGAGVYDASGAAAARAAVGNCSAGQYGTATTTSGLTCAQVAYSQVSGTPTLPTIASTTNLLSGDGSGNAVSSGIAASNVPLLNAANTFSAAQTITGTASIHQTLTGGATQNGLEYDAIGGHAQMYTASAGSGTGIGSGSGWMLYDITNIRWPFYYDDIADTATISMPLTVTGAATLGASSTASNGSSQKAICLADGTHCPAIPTVGTWGALNYPPWVSGTPFVKMTAAGTFALDTNTYLTSSGISGMTTGQLPVAASATTVTSSIPYATANTASTIVERDGSGNFSAGTITANLTGTASGNLTTSGVSGMTATQVPIAATATTITSSKALAGSGAGITTGPTSSTSGDLMSFTGTAGQAADSGIAASNVFQLPSLTSGSVLFSNGSTISQDNSNFFWDATNHRLGIGTTGPSNKLVIQQAGGNLLFDVNNTSLASTYSGMRVLNNGAEQWFFGTDGSNANGDWYMAADAARPTWEMQNSTGKVTFPVGSISRGYGSGMNVIGNVSIGSGYYATAAPTNGMIIQGNVGIGTTGPTQALDVAGNILLTGESSKNITFDLQGNSYDSAIIWRKDTSPYAISAQISSVNEGAYGIKALAFYTTNAGDFSTNAVERMRVASNGNITIGDTTATSMFNVGTANQFQVSSTGVASMAAGSTVNSTAICLADGTGGCVTLGGAVSCSNVTLGSGAGTGASCNAVIGYDSGHSIEITTGTTPAGLLATLFTFAFTTSRSEKPVCAVVPALYQYTLMSQVPVTLSGGSTTTYSVIAGSSAVPASTSLNFQVVCN